MKPQIKNCTTDVQKILRDAEKYSVLEDLNGIKWDDIILATFYNAENFEHSDAFFAVLWINNRSKISSYINYINQQVIEIDYDQLGIWKWKIQFDEKFEKVLNKYDIKKGEKRDIIKILEAWFSDMSKELKQLFYRV